MNQYDVRQAAQDALDRDPRQEPLNAAGFWFHCGIVTRICYEYVHMRLYAEVLAACARAEPPDYAAALIVLEKLRHFV